MSSRTTRAGNPGVALCRRHPAVTREVGHDKVNPDERYDLSRHWRNARTHASHDPVSWKYHHIGNYLLNDALPPNYGQL